MKNKREREKEREREEREGEAVRKRKKGDLHHYFLPLLIQRHIGHFFG